MATKIINLDGKHLVAYVEYMQEQGLSASTIKTSLSAIRFFHDKLDRPNFTLPANDELGVILERRRFGGVDRTWSDPEFNKMLVPDDKDTHHAMNAMERFIGKYRPKVQMEGREAPLIYHGLRHTYASEKYQEFIDSGMNPLDAHLKVSELLGHERPDVTNIYLASRRKKEGKAYG